MTKTKFPFLVGILCFCFSFALFSSAFGAAIFSPTLEEMKCRKIADTEERALCYGLIRKKERELEQQQATDIAVGKETDKVDFSDERIDWRMHSCLRIYNADKRDLCFQKFRQEVEYERRQAEKAEAQKAEALQKQLQQNQQAHPLTIKKCEDLSSHRERIVCYADFHEEQLQKNRQAQRKQTEEQTDAAVYSPTLARMKCQKISDREERNDCLKDVYFSEREREAEQRANAIETFDLDEALRECYEINDDDRREDCLDDVADLAEQVADEDISEREWWRD